MIYKSAEMGKVSVEAVTALEGSFFSCVLGMPGPCEHDLSTLCGLCGGSGRDETVSETGIFV